ncbi:hypothetical protein G7Y79_00014g037500 [Physcia stellaris]|nr:hypothetical protein G7Y79_00014g037500 [Physcia stellaris]
MMELTTLCIQLLYLAQIAIASPRPLNAAAPIALSPSTSDNVTSLERGVSPPLPPGFALTTQSIKGLQLNPYDAHMAVITFMELGKSLNWNDHTQNVERRYHGRFQTPVMIAIVVSKPDFRTPPMTNGHVMLALQYGVHSMERTGRLDGTPLIAVKVEVTLFGRPVGTVSITRTKTYSRIGSAPSDNTTQLSTHGSVGNQTSTLSDPATGQFTDPRFWGLSLQYRYYKDEEKDTVFKVFGCIMEAMIILAYDGNYVLFDKLTARGTGKRDASGLIKTFELDLRAVAPQNPEMGLVSSSLLMLAEFYLWTIPNWWSNSKVAEMDFAVEQEILKPGLMLQARGVLKMISFRPLAANGSIATA